MSTLSFQLPLNTTADQFDQLGRLQTMFAAVCNFITPVVVEHRCWNRVALHHLTYRRIRNEYPDLGSQMACNAIYAVCKVARVVYQKIDEPSIAKNEQRKSLPRIEFTGTCPVYFDWHTLTLRNNKLSIFTLNGRIKFDLFLTNEQNIMVEKGKLIEILLLLVSEGVYGLVFKFKFETEFVGMNIKSNAAILPAREYCLITDNS